MRMSLQFCDYKIGLIDTKARLCSPELALEETILIIYLQYFDLCIRTCIWFGHLWQFCECSCACWIGNLL